METTEDSYYHLMLLIYRSALSVCHQSLVYYMYLLFILYLYKIFSIPNIHVHLFLIPLLLQVIVVPCGITVSVDDTKKNEITKYCESVISSLTDAGIRAKGDFRYNYSPGWKFNHWELKVLKDAA